MTTTIKDVEAAIDKYNELPSFLAGVRATIYELASVGKKHYELREKAEAKLEAAEAQLAAMPCYLTWFGYKEKDGENGDCWTEHDADHMRHCPVCKLNIGSEG